MARPKTAKKTTTAKPRAHERWLCAVYELDLNFALVVENPDRSEAAREAERVAEARTQLRAFARSYGRRVKRFDSIETEVDGAKRWRIVAVFDSRFPALGVQHRLYRPNKDRAHAIQVSWARANQSRRGGAN